MAPRIGNSRLVKIIYKATKWGLEWQMKERKLELASTATVMRHAKDPRNLLSDSSLTERKSFIKSFVKEVRVTGDKALLNYTMPLRRLTIEKLPSSVS